MIRTIENKDIDKIMDIWLTSTIEAHNFIPTEYWHKNYNTVKDVYLPIAETFIYEDEENIKGFISIIDNEFIGALFVHTEYQNKGIGTKLIDYAVDKYKALNLAVYKENQKSVQFYINRGFKIISEQINEDSCHSEYIMQKN